MTIQEVRSDAAVLPRSRMSELVIDAMTTTRSNVDLLCEDSDFHRSVVDAAVLLIEALSADNRVFACGNGGSMSDAMHFAEELTGNFRAHRRPLSAMAISDSAHLTCVGNDFGFDQVFARAVEAHGRRGDALLAISTSGKSPNVLNAVASAKAKGLSTIGLVGHPDSPLANAVDVAVVTAVDSKWADRVQELHIMVIHMLVELVEAALFAPDQSRIDEIH
jgi:D-sedoheptulose 7-phosphate isomerase